MTDWATIIGTTAVGLGATGVAGAGALLVRVAVKVASIESKLDAHVAQEDTKDEALRTRLEGIEKKLPNGEVEQTWKMVSDIFEYFEPDIRTWREEKAARAKTFYEKEDKR
jgi:hypothetical protein